jgi:hypothetical protein
MRKPEPMLVASQKFFKCRALFFDYYRLFIRGNLQRDGLQLSLVTVR